MAKDTKYLEWIRTRGEKYILEDRYKAEDGTIPYRILDAVMPGKKSEANRKRHNVSRDIWKAMFGRGACTTMMRWLASTYYTGPDHVHEFIKYRINSMRKESQRI